VRETFFFVVPSTSGRVVSYQVCHTSRNRSRSIYLPHIQLPDKVKLFAQLKATVENYKQSKIDSREMTVIMLPKDCTNVH